MPIHTSNPMTMMPPGGHLGKGPNADSQKSLSCMYAGYLVFISFGWLHPLQARDSHIVHIIPVRHVLCVIK